jgi:hypothetical protein
MREILLRFIWMFFGMIIMESIQKKDWGTVLIFIGITLIGPAK